MYISAIYLITLCGGKKDKDSDRSTAMGSVRPQPPAAPASPAQPPAPKPPAQGGVAGTYDPNYQTLAGVQGDVFGADKKKPAANGGPPAPQKPAVGNQMADSHYRPITERGTELNVGAASLFLVILRASWTMGQSIDCGYKKVNKWETDRRTDYYQICGEIVSAMKVGTYDPNYQTLAGVQGDVFGPDKKKAASPAAPPVPQKPAVGGMAGTYDPNYQTLAGMNADVFGADKKK
ncbi:hypothetical protein TELCIR_01385 [Teladorsagia circumcincta]|uniref:Uncharacterized protein n=1 Tax=Teladorsagia circumcincta TaxID=45464 RepID=A0A2G9V2F8_TELCI|nr:hypothetical protein TELCIR_01385 [Teladorsagia circumcincta]